MPTVRPKSQHKPKVWAIATLRKDCVASARPFTHSARFRIMVQSVETEDLEPSFGAVLAVGVAEFSFEDTSFVSSAPQLPKNYRQQEQQPVQVHG